MFITTLKVVYFVEITACNLPWAFLIERLAWFITLVGLSSTSSVKTGTVQLHFLIHLAAEIEDLTTNQKIRETCWKGKKGTNVDHNNNHKSEQFTCNIMFKLKYLVLQCTGCKEAWKWSHNVLASSFCLRCPPDKQQQKTFSKENDTFYDALSTPGLTQVKKKMLIACFSLLTDKKTLAWSGHVYQRQGRGSSIRTLLWSMFCQHENETTLRETRDCHIVVPMFYRSLQARARSIVNANQC